MHKFASRFLLKQYKHLITFILAYCLRLLDNPKNLSNEQFKSTNRRRFGEVV